MSETKLEVGQLWVGKQYGESKEIVWIGERLLVYKSIESSQEVSMDVGNFKALHYLKKPEPKLTKLVAWAHKSNSDDVVISGDNDKDLINIRIKKQIIVKDDQLYVVD